MPSATTVTLGALLLASSAIGARVPNPRAAAQCAGVSAIAQAYTPVVSACPSGFQLVRSAATNGSSTSSGTSSQSLSTLEQDYISSRESGPIVGAWETYLANVINASSSANLSSSLPSYVSSILNGSAQSFPRLGLATSGGGYRASIFGSGVLNALDARNESSSAIGTGGLLQAASYLAGLSGGAWLVTSAVQAGLPSFEEVAFGIPNSDPNTGYGGWNAELDLLAPTDDPIELLAFYNNIISEVQGKHEAGFPLTITDPWARLLARHFANGTDADNFFDECASLHGAGELWSDIANTSFFQSFEVPFPIVISDSLFAGQNDSAIIPGDDVPISNVIYEFNPFEMGSYDPLLASFVPTQFLGSTNSSVCVTGYDQITFVAGTSSNLFNAVNITADFSSTLGVIMGLLDDIIDQPDTIELDAAAYPNPFQGVNPSTFPDSNQTFLTLVDGGLDGENVPVMPLLVQARGIDTIFAIDASSDTNNFAVGSALIATQDRAQLFPGTYAFPSVPNDTATFEAQNLTTQPTFFGCNDSSPIPLVVYIANGGPARGEPAITNTSTFQVQYDPQEIQEMLDQTFDIATQGIAPESGSDEKDPAWAACLACAIVDRTRAKLGEERSGLCGTCFERYCWNPSS